MIKNLFKDTVKYLPSKIIPAMVGIVALPIITRLFTPADYGNYVLVIATVSILSTLVGWVSMSVVRFYPAYEKEGKTAEFTELIIKLTFLSIFVIFVISLCILLPLQGYIPENLYYLFGIGIIVFILTSCFVVLLDFLRIKRRIKWYSGFFVWNSISALVFGVLFVILFHLGVEGLLLGTILSISFALPSLWKIAMGKLRIRDRAIPFKPTIEMMKYSFPLVVGNLAAWILSLSDRYVLEFFRGAHEVGVYSISYSISQSSIMIFISLFFLSFNPLAIITWEKEGEKVSQKFVSQGTRYFLLLCIPAVISISVLQNPIMKVLSTPEYYGGAKIIPLVVSGIFFLGLMQMFDVGLCLQKKTYINLFCVTLSGILNLGLNFVLVPKYGYMAAAATTLISYAFLLVLMIFVSRRFFVWEFPFKSLAKISCASIVMGIVVYYIGNSLTSSALINLISGMFVGIVVYVVMLLLLREPQKEEIQELQELKSKILMKMKQLITNRK